MVDKPFVLPPNITLGAVELFVSDLPAMKRFYREAVGLQPYSDVGGTASMGIDSRILLRLTERKNLALAPRGSAGMFHFAFVYESEPGLARALRTLMFKAQNAYSGSADHLVSEAFYASDPEGNGFELYVDRDRALWKYDGDQLLMATMYLDPKDFIFAHAEKQGRDGVRLGHVHLKVGDLKAAEDFYVGSLGFSKVSDTVPGAVFVSAGGYHHHIGFNIWESKGSGPKEDSLGLGNFEIYLPGPSYLEELKQHLEGTMVGYRDIERGISVLDPWGNDIHILAAGI